MQIGLHNLIRIRFLVTSELTPIYVLTNCLPFSNSAARNSYLLQLENYIFLQNSHCYEYTQNSLLLNTPLTLSATPGQI